jgi:predicted TIM-barrel fold metal-dependent hydrolase
MAAGRRYAPDYDAPLGAYLGVLDKHGIARGVLVQPSFYGTDNSYILECLAAEPRRLRGVAVLAPETKDEDLETLDRGGIVGVRFNLIGAGPGPLKEAAQRQLLRRVQAFGWHVEVQAEGADWPSVLRALEDHDGPIVADHFGRPDPAKGTACEGFQAILREGRNGRIYVKLSAPYRCGGADVQPYAEALMQRLGPRRLLWGSDWPWTQFESGRDYGALAAAAAPEAPPFSQLLAPTAARLFRFADIG